MRFIKTALLLMLLMIPMILTSCSALAYRDGTYTAQSPEFASSGWKDIVELTIKDGEIVKIDWDAIYKNDSIPIRKKQYSKSGLYGMLAAGASDEWYDQAITAEKFVLDNGIEALTVKQDGYTDAVSSCTIHVNEFEKLLRECLKQAKK